MTEQKKNDAKEGESFTMGESSKEGAGLPLINFSTFIFSLNSAAMVHLGLVDEPSTGSRMRNLELAKQTIDILGMLAEKTRGNLSKEEDDLLRNILRDLRMMYVKEHG